MQTDSFIFAAYAITGVLVALLCLTTYLRWRRVNARLAEAERHEA